MFGFIQKQCPENFAQLNLRMLELFTCEVCIFLKKSRLIFKRFYCFCMFVNKHCTNTGSYISESKRCQNAKPSEYYFYTKTKISLDFHITFKSSTYILHSWISQIISKMLIFDQQDLEFLRNVSISVNFGNSFVILHTGHTCIEFFPKT